MISTLPLLFGLTWSAVNAIAAATAVVGTAVFWVLWRLHKRLRGLENGETEHEKALFGDRKDNPLNVGLAREVASVKDDLSDLSDRVDAGAMERRELQKQLDRTEDKLDRILEKLNE